MKTVKNIIIIFLFVLFSFFSGCKVVFVEPEEDITPSPTPTEVSVEEIENPILINDGRKYTNDPLVNLTLSALGASYMMFSGDKISWSDWIPYSDSYEGFDLFHGPGCVEIEGTRKVFVKFKYPDETVLGPFSASIILDITSPFLKYIRWIDKNVNLKIDKGDILKIGFSESMDEETVTLDTLESVFLLDEGKSSFDALGYSWDEECDELSIVLGGELDFGTIIAPLEDIKDKAGNSIDTSITLTLPYTTHHKLSYIEVSPDSIEVSAGDTPVKITVKAYDTRQEDITDLCTFSWSFMNSSSQGTLSSSSGSTIFYIPPDSEEGEDASSTSSKDIIEITAVHESDPPVVEIIYVTIN